MNLDEARDEHRKFLRQLAQGVNPLDERRQKRRCKELPDDFESVSERWYEKAKAGKSKSWLQANRRYLDASWLAHPPAHDSLRHPTVRRGRSHHLRLA